MTLSNRSHRLVVPAAFVHKGRRSIVGTSFAHLPSNEGSDDEIDDSIRSSQRQQLALSILNDDAPTRDRHTSTSSHRASQRSVECGRCIRDVPPWTRERRDAGERPENNDTGNRKRPEGHGRRRACRESSLARLRGAGIWAKGAAIGDALRRLAQRPRLGVLNLSPGSTDLEITGVRRRVTLHHTRGRWRRDRCYLIRNLGPLEETTALFSLPSPF